MSEALRVLLLMVPGIVGAELVCGRPGRGGWRWIDAAALGAPIGLGVASLCDFALRMAADRSLEPADLAVVWLVLLALALAARRACRPEPVHPEAPAARAWAEATGVILLVYFTFSLDVLLTVMGSAPGGAGDGAVIWAMLSKTLACADGSLAGVLDQLRLGIHAEYPHFVPGSTAFLLRGAGVDALWPGRLVAGSAWFVLVFGTRRVLAALAPGAVANTGALLVAATPQTLRLSGDLYADPWIAALNVLIVGCLFADGDRGRHDRGALVAGGFLLGLLGWTKQEGAVLAVVLTAVALVVLLRRANRGRRMGDALALIVPSCAGHAASFLLRARWVRPDDRTAPAGELWSNFCSGERWSNVARGAFEELHARGQVFIWNAPEGINAPLSRWGFFWPSVALILVAGLLLRRGGPRRLALVMSGVFVVEAAAYAVIFATVRFEQEWHIETALSRLMSQIAPVAVLAAMVSFGRAREENPVAAGEPPAPSP